MPGKKKKYNARFPPARIKKIMQTDEDVGKVAAAVPVIISRSLELFIDSLIERTATVTRAKNAKTLSTSHIKQAIYSEKTFDFLRDLVKAIPDHQVDEDGDGAVASGSGPPEKKPKAAAKPRKPREEGARGRGRPRKVKPEPEVKKSSSSDEDDDEETETDEEQTSQEEACPSDHASNSPAYNPVQPPAQPSFTPPQAALQSRLDPSQDTSAIPCVSVSSPQISGVSHEQMANPMFSHPMMTQRPFQPHPNFPMHNYHFPGYAMPPGGPSLGPPTYLPPISTNISPQHSPLPPHMVPGMMSYPPFMAPLSPFSGSPDRQGMMGPNGSQAGRYPNPGLAGGYPVSTSGQTSGQPVSSHLSNHHDANVPLDMSITGKSRPPSLSQSQVGPGSEGPLQLTSIPVPRGLPALVSPGYGFPPRDPISPSAQPKGYGFPSRGPASPSAHPQGYRFPTRDPDSSSTQPHPAEQQGHLIHAQPVYPPHTTPNHCSANANKTISEEVNTDSQKGDNPSVSVPEIQINTAVDLSETSTTRPKTVTEDNGKGLVSFPGLSNIMKVNSLQPASNGDDEDYDT